MQPQYNSSTKKLHNKVQSAQTPELKAALSDFILGKKTNYDKFVSIPKNFWNYVLHEEKSEGLGVIGLNPSTKYERNPLLDIARGVVYDTKLHAIISVPMDERCNIPVNSVPVVGKKLSFKVTSESGKDVYSDFNVPLNKVRFYPNYQGIYIRLIQHNGKVYFATNSRIKVYDPNVQVDPRYTYDTKRYMRMFLDASKIMPEDVFDTKNYQYSNICHYFLLESKEFSKSTYKSISRTTVYYLSSDTSYDSSLLPGVNFDSVNRYQNKLPTIGEITIEQANKLLANGYTNNPTEPELLSGGESVIVEGDNFGFRLTPQSYLWRRSFIEPEIFEDDAIKFLRALNTPSKFTYKLTLEEAFERAGSFTWSDSNPGESENYNEAIQDRIISYLLSCSFYDQLNIQDLYKRTLEEPLQELTNFFYQETAYITIGNEKPGESIIPHVDTAVRPLMTEIFEVTNKLSMQCSKSNLPTYECKDLIHDMLKTYNVSSLYSVKRAVDAYQKNKKRILSRTKSEVESTVAPAITTN